MMVRHLACSYAGPVAAVAAFERTVATCDIKSGRHLATFDTILDFGGKRLAVDPSGRLCAAAAYDREGLACYDAATGAEVWKRRDLKRLQVVSFSHDGHRLYCASDHRGCEVVSAQTGQRVSSIRGVREVWESPTGDIRFEDRANPALANIDGRRLASVKRTTFAFLDVAFGPDSFCTSESGGPVRCLDLQAKEQWRYTPLPGSHVLKLAYDVTGERYIGVEWPYSGGGDMTLMHFPTSAPPKRITTFPASDAIGFWARGSHLLHGPQGFDIDVSSGAVTRTVAFFGSPQA